MSAAKMSKMLESAGAKFTKEVSGSNVFLKVPVPGGDYNVELLFENKGEDFFSAIVTFDDGVKSIKKTQVSDSPSSMSDDYSTIVNMVKNAPEKHGDYQEAKSQDGKYIGLLYQDYDCEYGVAFVCLASTKQFLGVVGY
jgi:hypothetical protein